MPAPTITSQVLQDDGRYLVTLSDGAQFYVSETVIAQLALPLNAAQETGGNLATLAGAVGAGKLLANLQQVGGVALGAARAPADALAAASAALDTNAANLLFNGTTWDQQRNNVAGTLAASAARTATFTSAAQTNYNARGVIVFTNVTAVGATGADTLTVRVLAVDPVSGATFPLYTQTNLITASNGNSVYAVQLYPGISEANATFVERVSRPLPRLWQVSVTPSNSDSWTYSVGYSLIQ